MPVKTKPLKLTKTDKELLERALNRLIFDEEMQLVHFAQEHFVVGSDGQGNFQKFAGKTFADLTKFVDENPEAGKWHALTVLERLRGDVVTLKKKLDGE